MTRGRGYAVLVPKLPVMVLAIAMGSLHSQTGPSTRPEFEVASVKFCKDGLGSGAGTSSPGRFNVTCRTLEYLIQQAYDVYASGKPDPANTMVARLPIEGGPDWIESELYTIDAKPAGKSTQEMMRGPMMQRLLEDRFRLEIRRVIRETDVYALIVAKGGFRLKPTEAGSCTPLDMSEIGPPSSGRKPWCAIGHSARKGPNITWEAHGLTLAGLAKSLGLDRPVINRTGIAGMFDIRLESAVDQASPAPGRDGVDSDDPLRGPSIFTAVQEQLGLRLIPGKGPSEFLVISHVERPSEN